MTVADNKNEVLAGKISYIPEENLAISQAASYLFAKRVIDVLGAVTGLIFLAPLFLVIFCLIKLELPKEPVFFKQKRIGINGKSFYMYKFRSMVTNAEALKEMLRDKNEASGPVFKIKSDPRVTKTGKFIRKTSIDELPQLVNVLKGEMSLVGPRPPLPDEVEQYTGFEMQRLSVVPGLTCYWQVSGRSNVSFEEWVKLDLKYICERSITVDLKLILKTVTVLFGSKDAY